MVPLVSQGGSSMRNVILLSGWKGSGKDTAAEYLAKQYQYTQLSLASKLKDIVSSTYRVPREDLDNPTRKEMPLHHLPVIPTDSFTESVQSLLSNELSSGYWTPRALCILEGSIKRAVYANYWSRELITEILDNPELNYVISDVRYLSEMDTLRMFIQPDQLLTLRLNRHQLIETTDPSERDLDKYNFDMVLSNTGTKEELYEAMDFIASAITQY